MQLDCYDSRSSLKMCTPTKAEQKVSVMAERDSANHETRGYNSAVANTQAVGSIPRLPIHSDTTVHNSIRTCTYLVPQRSAAMADRTRSKQHVTDRSSHLHVPALRSSTLCPAPSQVYPQHLFRFGIRAQVVEVLQRHR